MSENRRHGVLWALGAALFGALFLLPWKVAGGFGNPAVAVLVLLSTAAVFNTALVPVMRPGRTRARRRRTELSVAFTLAVFTLLGNLASAEAVRRLSPSVLSVLQRAELLIVALTAWFWLGERVDRRFWAGAGLAGIGLVLVQGFDISDVDHVGGILLGIASAACFGLMSVIVRKNIQSIDPAIVNAERLWFSVALWFPLNGAPPPIGEIDLGLAGYAALAGVFGPSLSRLCLMYSARHVEARITSLTTLLVPVLTLVLALIVLGDLPEPRQLVGGAVMLVGIALPILAWGRR